MIILTEKLDKKFIADNLANEDGFVKGVINIRNNQAHGFPRGGMSVEDPDIRQTAKQVILKWIQL